jgi:hypothetical protein
VQVADSPTLHNSGSWQIGGTPRADEYAYQSLAGLGQQFTTTFEWRPELSSREWHRDIYIASWSDGNNSIDLYYDQSESRFTATDGNNTATTTKTFTWEHLDSIKFAFTNMVGGFRLSVETPLSGSEHVSSGGTLLGSPTEVKFGTNNAGSGYACGLIATVRHWDRDLAASEVEMVWDIYGPTGDLNSDWYVDLADFVVFSQHWLESGCEQSSGCGGADLDKNDTVDWSDLKTFSNNWLSGL